MSGSETVHVNLGDRSYDVLVGEGLLASAGDHIKPLMKLDRTVIVTDENVAPLHLETLQRSLELAGISSDVVILPPGDGTKSFAHLQTLIDTLLSHRIERSSSLIALGGGMIGDITGFAAAVLLRGIDYIQIPTSLLAQVDSSVGGKTGINSRMAKTLSVPFINRVAVLADINVLNTLPGVNWRPVTLKSRSTACSVTRNSSVGWRTMRPGFLPATRRPADIRSRCPGKSGHSSA